MSREIPNVELPVALYPGVVDSAAVLVLMCDDMHKVLLIQEASPTLGVQSLYWGSKWLISASSPPEVKPVPTWLKTLTINLILRLFDVVPKLSGKQRYSYQVGYSKGLRDNLPEAKDKDQTPLWARLNFLLHNRCVELSKMMVTMGLEFCLVQNKHKSWIYIYYY